MFEKIRGESLQICPQFADFEFNSWDPDSEVSHCWGSGWNWGSVVVAVVVVAVVPAAAAVEGVA